MGTHLLMLAQARLAYSLNSGLCCATAADTACGDDGVCLHDRHAHLVVMTMTLPSGCHAAPYLLFAQHLGASFDGYPKIQEYLKEVKARTAVAQVLKLHEQANTMGQRNYFSGLI